MNDAHNDTPTTCPHCAAVSPATARFCGRCGASLAASVAADTDAVPAKATRPSRWWHIIPGFRSGVRWKQVVAVAVYGLVVLLTLVWLFSTPLFALWFAAVSMGFIALVFDVRGLRSRIPFLNAPTRLRTAGGWASLGVGALFLLGVIAVIEPSDEPSSVASSPPSSTTRALVGGAQPRAVSAAAPAAPPTPAPSPAAPSTPSPLPATTPTPVATPSLSPEPTPTPAPTPQALANAAFGVSTDPVGCHAAASAEATTVVQWERGTARSLDQRIRLDDGVWYHQPDQDCWIRTEPGPLRVFQAQREAHDFAATLAPQAVLAPTFAVNTAPVGCHSSPDGSAPIVQQRPSGTVQAMDAVLRANDGVWHRETAARCWTRTLPGPLRLYDALDVAEDDGSVLRNPRLDLNRSRKVGNLDIVIQSAWVRPDPADASRHQLVFGIQVTNQGTGTYDYDMARSFTLQPGSQAALTTARTAPWLTTGQLQRGESRSGYVAFLYDGTSYVRGVGFRAIGSSNSGEIAVNFHRSVTQLLVVGSPTPVPTVTPARTPAPTTAPVAAPANAPAAVGRLAVTASLSRSTCDGGMLPITVTVRDGSGRPVAGAAVSVHAEYRTTTNNFQLPPTNRAGQTSQNLAIGRPRGGYTVVFSVTARADGVSGTTTTSCFAE